MSIRSVWRWAGLRYRDYAKLLDIFELSMRIRICESNNRHELTIKISNQDASVRKSGMVYSAYSMPTCLNLDRHAILINPLDWDLALRQLASCEFSLVISLISGSSCLIKCENGAFRHGWTWIKDCNRILAFPLVPFAKALTMSLCALWLLSVAKTSLLICYPACSNLFRFLTSSSFYHLISYSTNKYE